MQVLSLSKETSEEIIRESLIILKKGGVIVYPTESFYALGVLATDKIAVRRVYELKKRPAEKPLPVIVGDMTTLESIVEAIPPQARPLMERFWPGPLTLIFAARSTLPDSLTGGTGKVAIRIPGEGIALHIARAAKCPITSTSANPSASPPAQKSTEVTDYFGDKIDLLIDIGETPGGRPSTIVDVTVVPPKVIREGAIHLK